ncbi:FAD/NAD(P)-binding protein [Streptomyces sp. NPDC002285]
MRICIIGGGTASACLVAALGREMPDRNIDISVVDPSDSLWRGRAYGTDLDAARVNAPPKIMSLNPHDSDEAMEWLATHYDSSYHPEHWKGDTLPPRSAFGGYIQAQVSATIKDRTVNGRWRFEHIREVAEWADRKDGNIVVRTSTQREIYCDVLVLCIGNGAEYDPYNLGSHKGYISSAYPLKNALGNVSPTASVAVIGAGLSAVDVVFGLSELGHRGQILLISRRGLFPSVRRKIVAAKPQVLTVEAIKSAVERVQGNGSPSMDLAGLSRLAYREALKNGATRDSVIREVEPPDWGLERLRRHVGESLSSDTWQQVVIWALFTTVQDWWPLLTERDRRIFHEKLHPVWASFINPMPRSSAQTLLKLADEGRLRVERGLSQAIPYGPKIKLTSQQSTTYADVTVSAATNSRHIVPHQARPIIESLISAGHAHSHPDGGLRVEAESGQLLDAKGNNTVPIFALGNLTGGTHYYTSAVALLVTRSQKMAESLRLLPE